jgi:hypothetical protein
LGWQKNEKVDSTKDRMQAKLQMFIDGQISSITLEQFQEVDDNNCNLVHHAVTRYHKEPANLERILELFKQLPEAEQNELLVQTSRVFLWNPFMLACGHGCGKDILQKLLPDDSAYKYCALNSASRSGYNALMLNALNVKSVHKEECFLFIYEQIVTFPPGLRNSILRHHSMNNENTLLFVLANNPRLAIPVIYMMQTYLSPVIFAQELQCKSLVNNLTPASYLKKPLDKAVFLTLTNALHPEKHTGVSSRRPDVDSEFGTEMPLTNADDFELVETGEVAEEATRAPSHNHYYPT